MPNGGIKKHKLTMLVFALAFLFAGIFGVMFSKTDSSEQITFVSADTPAPAYRTGGETGKASFTSNSDLTISGGQNIEIKFSDNYKKIYINGTVEKTLNLNNGYRLLSYEIKSKDVTYTITFSYADIYAETPNGIEKIESNRAGETISTSGPVDFSLTPEMLDPYYTSRVSSNKITITPSTELITYKLHKWYDNENLNNFSAKDDEDFTIETQTEQTGKKKLDDLSTDTFNPTDRTFKRWVLTDKNASSYNFITNGLADNHVKITKSNLSIEFEYEGKKVFNNTNYYYLTNIVKGSYGQLDDNDVLIRAMWMYDYEVTLNGNGNHGNTTLSGAYTKYDDTQQASSTFYVNAQVAYNFQATTDGNTAFYKFADKVLTEFEGTPTKGNTSNVFKNGYFVYNYGYEITNWTICSSGGCLFYSSNSNGWENKQVLTLNDVNTLCGGETRVTTKTMCDYLDEYYLGQTTINTSLTMTPTWKAENIKLYGYDGTSNISLNSVAANGTDTVEYGKQYSICKESKITGKTLTYYVTKENTKLTTNEDNLKYLDKNSSSSYGHIIASYDYDDNLIWNYTLLDARINEAGQIFHDGTNYAITLLPVYVDNIYKINLNLNYINNQTNLQTTYALNTMLGSYAVADSGLSGDCYTFFTLDSNFVDNCYSSYNSWKNGKSDTTIEKYIGSSLKNALHDYLAGINGSANDELSIKTYSSNNISFEALSYTDSGNTGYDFLKKVFNSTTINENTNLYIYLVNDHQTADLPVFNKKSCELIGWYNGVKAQNDGEKQNYAYTTRKYANDCADDIIELHKIALSDVANNVKLISTSEVSNPLIAGPIIWKLEEMSVSKVEGSDVYSQELIAVFYRKSYDIDVKILLDNEEGLKSCGHILIFADSVKYGGESTAKTNALILARVETNAQNQNEIVYYLLGENYNSTNFANQKVDGYYPFDTNSKITNPKLYGDVLYIKAFDQSNETVSGGHFDYLIGYKFNNVLTSHNDEVSITKMSTTNYKIDELSFAYNTYNQNYNSGFDLKDGSKITIVATYNKLTYQMAFKLKDINNDKNNQMGYLYGDYSGESFSVSNITVNQEITLNYSSTIGYEWANPAIVYSLNSQTLQGLIAQTKTFVFSAENLRNYYYSQNGYAVTYPENINLGVIYFNTQKIDFDIKTYVVNGENIIETISTLNYQINTNYEGIFNKVEKFNNGPYAYKNGDNYYALVNLKYKNSLGQYVDFVQEYDFVLNSKDALKYNFTNYLTNMFNSAVGKILPAPHTIELKLEVSPIYKIQIAVKQVDKDSNSSNRSTLIYNIANQTTNSASLSSTTIDWESENQIYENASGTKYYLGESFVYSYYGLTNFASSNYDDNYYSGVKYSLGQISNNIITEGEALTSSEFDVSSDSILIVEYLPKSIVISSVKYQIDGQDVENLNNELQALSYSNIYEIENQKEKYYLGDELYVSLKFSDPIYDAIVKFNDAQYRIENKSLDEIYSVTHTLTNSDLQKKGITITINLISNSSDNINVYYQLVNESDIKDNVGSMSAVIYVSSTVDRVVATIENDESNNPLKYIQGFSVNEGRKIVVDISNLNKGYSYAGVVVNNGNELTKVATANKIVLTESFTKGENTFYIKIQKDKININIDTSNSELEDRSQYNLRFATQNSLSLTKLNVGDEVVLPTSVDFDNSKCLADFVSEYVTEFYWLDSSKPEGEQKQIISNVEKINQAFTILTSMLSTKDANNEYNITIYPTIVQRYKLDYSFNNVQNYANLSVKYNNAQYTSGTYLEADGNIVVKLSSSVIDKINVIIKLDGVVLDETTTPDYSTIYGDIISDDGLTISLDRNRSIEVSITLKEYDFEVKYTVYKTLEELNSGNPTDVLVNNSAINSTTTYDYDSPVSATSRQFADIALYKIVIKGDIGGSYQELSFLTNETININSFNCQINNGIYTISSMLESNLIIEFQYRDIKIISHS